MIWNLNISNDQIRIKFLGLNFSFRIKKIAFFTNKVYQIKNGVKHRIYSNPKGVCFIFKGNNAEVNIAVGNYKNCFFYLENNSKAIIHEPHKWGANGLKLHIGDDCEVQIQEGFNSVNAKIIAIDCATKVKIGKNCMFAENVLIRTHDGHVIYSLKDLKAFNEPKDIIIGNDVWLGSDVTVLKGVSIANNTVVGTKSLVSSSSNKENVIIAGCPAKIIKENIGWNRRRYSVYVKDYENLHQ